MVYLNSLSGGKQKRRGDLNMKNAVINFDEKDGMFSMVSFDGIFHERDIPLIMVRNNYIYMYYSKDVKGDYVWYYGEHFGKRLHFQDLITKEEKENIEEILKVSNCNIRAILLYLQSISSGWDGMVETKGATFERVVCPIGLCYKLISTENVSFLEKGIPKFIEKGGEIEAETFLMYIK